MNTQIFAKLINSEADGNSWKGILFLLNTNKISLHSASGRVTFLLPLVVYIQLSVFLFCVGSPDGHLLGFIDFIAF